MTSCCLQKICGLTTLQPTYIPMLDSDMLISCLWRSKIRIIQNRLLWTSWSKLIAYMSIWRLNIYYWYSLKGKSWWVTLSLKSSTMVIIILDVFWNTIVCKWVYIIISIVVILNPKMHRNIFKHQSIQNPPLPNVNLPNK